MDQQNYTRIIHHECKSIISLYGNKCTTFAMKYSEKNYFHWWIKGRSPFQNIFLGSIFHFFSVWFPKVVGANRCTMDRCISFDCHTKRKWDLPLCETGNNPTTARRPKYCSRSPSVVTFPCECNIYNKDVKQYIINLMKPPKNCYCLPQ